MCKHTSRYGVWGSDQSVGVGEGPLRPTGTPCLVVLTIAACGRFESSTRPACISMHLRELVVLIYF